MKKILSIKHIKVFIALSMFLLVLSGTAFAIKDLGDLTLFCIDGQTQCCINGVQNCCDDNGTIYDTSCFGGNLCTLVGGTQSKYTASGCSYTTSTRTCCSNKKWSDWDTACPKTCNQSTKPSTSQSCYGGYKYRSVTCNNGNWVTGSWGDCDCSASGFETVMVSGHKCCQKTDGTGQRCATNDPIGYSWTYMTTTCYNESCYASSVSGCGTCNSGNRGSECSVSLNNRIDVNTCDSVPHGNNKACKLYRCQ